MSRYIDADAFVNKCEKAIEIKPYLESGLNAAISIAYSQPTADVRENVHGEWIAEGGGFWKCNQCGYGVEPYNNTPFCPNCGADLREEKS